MLSLIFFNALYSYIMFSSNNNSDWDISLLIFFEVLSITTMFKSASLDWPKANDIPFFSISFLASLIPAVSEIITGYPSIFRWVSTTSLVVPAISETIATSLLDKLFNKIQLLGSNLNRSFFEREYIFFENDDEKINFLKLNDFKKKLNNKNISPKIIYDNSIHILSDLNKSWRMNIFEWKEKFV